MGFLKRLIGWFESRNRPLESRNQPLESENPPLEPEPLDRTLRIRAESKRIEVFKPIYELYNEMTTVNSRIYNFNQIMKRVTQDDQLAQDGVFTYYNIINYTLDNGDLNNIKLTQGLPDRFNVDYAILWLNQIKNIDIKNITEYNKFVELIKELNKKQEIMLAEYKLNRELYYQELIDISYISKNIEDNWSRYPIIKFYDIEPFKEYDLTLIDTLINMVEEIVATAKLICKYYDNKYHIYLYNEEISYLKKRMTTFKCCYICENFARKCYSCNVIYEKWCVDQKKINDDINDTTQAIDKLNAKNDEITPDLDRFKALVMSFYSSWSALV